jgi:predicted TIM-barrel fold metal-dependent hydrolase
MQGSKQIAGQPARRLIVDSQVHLWKAESQDWPRIPGFPPQIPEPMTIERLVPMMDEAGVARVVVVPPPIYGGTVFTSSASVSAVRRLPPACLSSA